MTESKYTFMTVIFHFIHVGKHYFVSYQFTFYIMSDHRCEKPEAYKIMFGLCIHASFLKKSDQECGLQLQYDRRTTSTVHQGQKKILSTCNEWKILSSD